MTTRLIVQHAARVRAAATWVPMAVLLGQPSPLRAAQDAVTRTPLPAESPLAGLFWTFVVPLALFAIAVGATLALYRRFSQR